MEASSTHPSVSMVANLAWLFLSTIIKEFGWVDFKYSNELSQEIDQHDPLTIKWRLICSAIMAVLVIPFVFQKDLATLRFVSMYILVAMIYTIVVAPIFTAARHRPILELLLVLQR